MAAAMAYRGPDDSGAWVDPAVGLALAHRRLSILDLSPVGHQPMLSASGRYVIVFNGEIYNHLALRQELPGPWRGHSDTETLLAAIEAWGSKLPCSAPPACSPWHSGTVASSCCSWPAIASARSRCTGDSVALVQRPPVRARHWCLPPNWRRCGPGRASTTLLIDRRLLSCCASGPSLPRAASTAAFISFCPGICCACPWRWPARATAGIPALVVSALHHRRESGPPLCRSDRSPRRPSAGLGRSGAAPEPC